MVSERELASHARVAKRTIENIERNQRPVLLHTLRATAEALGVPVQAITAADHQALSYDDVLSPTPQLTWPQLAPTAPEHSHHSTPHRERRYATVLSLQILGLEQWWGTGEGELEEDEIPDRFFSPIEAVLHPAGGTLIQATQSGLSAMFGFPVTCEDHAVRALYIAVQMPAIVARAAGDLTREQPPSLDLRIGVHTGYVMVGREPTANLHFLAQKALCRHANHLAEAAPVGRVMVSEAVRQQAAGFFRFRGSRFATLAPP